MRAKTKTVHPLAGVRPNMRRVVLGLGVAAVLAACSGGEDTILSGKRLDPRSGVASQAASAGVAVENQSVKIALGKQVSRAAWTHTGAGPLHNAGHNAFTAGQPQVAWTAPIGKGNNRKYRITTDPVSAHGLVVAMDATATITAVSSTSGAPVWSFDLTPAGEKAGDANGGNLVIADKTLLVTSGYGELVALDVISGQLKWRQKIDAAGAAGLTVKDGLAYVVGADSRTLAISVADGRIKWEISGPDTVTSRVGAASPAVTDRLAIFPFSTGDLVGTFRKGGVRLWSSSLAGSRKGVVYANSSDITSDPVVVGDTFYVGNQAGRFGAFSVDGGARIWTADEGAYSPATVVGGAVFIVTDRNRLVRLNAATGAHVWAVQLPLYDQEKQRRRKGVYAHYGPVLAGGKLWVASSDGALRGYAPDSGALAVQVELPKPAASDPILVGGVMYLMLADGTLAALR